MRLTWKAEARIRDLFVRVCTHYGPSAYHRWAPPLVIYHDPKDGYCGWWRDDPPRVYVNAANHDTWEEVAGTLIDEYQHHLQDPTRTDEKRYEEEAAAVALRDAHLFVGHPKRRDVA